MGDSVQPSVVAYVTDVEGDVKYWNRYVDFSEVLWRDERGEVQLADCAELVYGGDAVDREGEVQFLSELLSLKRRYPDRVHLIIGNRDANKLRFRTELSEAHMLAVPLSEHPGCYWIPHLKPGLTRAEEELQSNSAVARVRWILEQTMGAPDAFEWRRQELSAALPLLDPSDEEVLRSFQAEVLAGGAVLEYLMQARLAAIVGGVLFVHAGLPRCSGANWRPGWVPAWEEGSAEKENLPVLDWVAEMERLRSSALGEYTAALDCEPGRDAWCTEGGYMHPQPGSKLNQFCFRTLPGGDDQPSPVVNGWLDADYMPFAWDSRSAEWVKQGGVRFVVSGHMPHGDAPLVIRGDGIDAITADITYAAACWWNDHRELDDEVASRGKHAVCEVIFGPEQGTARIHGILASGESYQADLSDPAIGCVTTDGWRVKGRCGDRFVLQRNTGWEFFGRLAHPREVELASS